MRLVRPAALKPGDTLGIVACSTPISRCPEATVQRAYARLRERGFEVLSWEYEEGLRKNVADNVRKLSGRRLD